MSSARWQGCRVAVSGAGGGIGNAVVRRFIAGGASSVALLDHDPSRLAPMVAAFGDVTCAIACDLADPRSIVEAADAIGAVDIFVNCAGVVLRKSLFETSFDEFEQVLRINLTGSVAIATEMARRMVGAGGGGVVVQVGSQLGFMSPANRAAYSTSKAALAQATRLAAVEWIGLGVRVVGVAPGPVATAMTEDVTGNPETLRAMTSRIPIGRLIEADEIAGIIEFLASPAASVIVGQTIIADGGWVLT